MQTKTSNAVVGQMHRKNVVLVLLLVVAIALMVGAGIASPISSAYAQDQSLKTGTGDVQQAENGTNAVSYESAYALISFENDNYLLYRADANGNKLAVDADVWGATIKEAEGNLKKVSTVFVSSNVADFGSMTMAYRLPIGMTVTTDWGRTGALNGFTKLVFLLDASGKSALKTIGDNALYKTKLTTIQNLENTSLESVGANAFSNTPLTAVVLPATCKTIGEGAFQDCAKLTTVTFKTGASPSNLLVTDAKTIFKAAKQKKASSSKALKYSQAILKRMKKASSQASWYKSKGSYGFFKFYGDVLGEKGAKQAMKALLREGYNNKDSYGDTFTSYTHLGADDDATSMQHFMEAVVLMNQGNELRKADPNFKGLDDLMYSDVLMAMAQSNANWSDVHTEHAANHGSDFNAGENAAWCNQNPYSLWYSLEKSYYDAGQEEGAGHYLNLTSNSYKAAGFGVCTRGTNYGWVTFIQEFSSGSKAGEDLYTFEQYKNRISNYLAFLEDSKPYLKLQSKQCRLLKSNLKKAKVDLNAAKKVVKTQEKTPSSACAVIGKSAFSGCKNLVAVNGFNKTDVVAIEANAFKNCASLKSLAAPVTLSEVAKSAFSGCKSLPASKTPAVFIGKTKVSTVKEQKFTGKALEPAITVKHGGKKLKAKTDYTLKYAINRSAGKGVITLIGKGKYYGIARQTFDIVF